MSNSLIPETVAVTDRWLVLSKPAGWLSVPGRGDHPCLSEWAREKFGPLWIVHRLDLETTGIILFAKTTEDHRIANEWFSRHEVKKLYEFIAQGQPRSPTFRVNARVEGAPSVTQIEVLERYREGFYGQARPLTGRTHQIRRHLAAMGNPLWGDETYRGPRKVILGTGEMEISRVALHARRLELPGGEVFEAPLPDDFRGWLERLRKEGHRE